jgi:hypothetical protein
MPNPELEPYQEGVARARLIVAVGLGAISIPVRDFVGQVFTDDGILVLRRISDRRYPGSAEKCCKQARILRLGRISPGMS